MKFYSLVFFLFFRYDWYFYNRTLGNLYGSDTSGMSGIHGYGSSLGNGGAGTSLFLGLTHPSILNSCKALPEHFLQKIDQWQILEPNSFASPIEAFINLNSFAAISQSEMSCLLGFSNDYIEVAKVRWLLQTLYSALELKLSNCVFQNVQKQRILKRQSPFRK